MDEEINSQENGINNTDKANESLLKQSGPETTKKTGKAPMFTTIFLLIVTLGLGGYIVYDKFLSDEEASGSNTTKVQATNSYEKFANNFKTGVSKYKIYNDPSLSDKDDYHYNIVYYNNQGAPYSLSAYVNSKGELYAHLILDGDMGENNIVKVADDVLNISIAYYGQGGTEKFYAIKENGTVSAITLSIEDSDSDGSFLSTVKPSVEDNFGSLKNIVAVIGGSKGVKGLSALDAPMFVDINGDVHTL